MYFDRCNVEQNVEIPPYVFFYGQLNYLHGVGYTFLMLTIQTKFGLVYLLAIIHALKQAKQYFPNILYLVIQRTVKHNISLAIF